MSISQVFDYVQFVVDSDSDWKIQASHRWIMLDNVRPEEIFKVSSLSAATEYKKTINFMLTKLQSRLAGKTSLKKGESMRLTKRNFYTLLILGELILYDDIKNVEKVMAGDISTLDYTALRLVHKRMLKTAEIASKTNIKEYLSKLSGFTFHLNLLFDKNYNHYVVRQIGLYNQRRAQRVVDKIVLAEDREAESIIYLRNRPKRDRRAPERLNITSTKSKSYLE